MKKNKLKILVGVIVTLIMCMCLFIGCSKEMKTYNVEVKSEGGKPISDVKVSVYKTDECENLIWAAESDDDGKITFEAEKSDHYAVVLENVPKGYQVAESYPLESTEIEIRLDIVLSDGNDLTEVTYELGDVYHDFTISAVNGKEYKLSELLEEKKAVILNFWYVNCGPCKMEFPYLQEAYEQYSDDVEVIAINPYDGTKDTVAAYAQEQSLTFPIVKGESEWATFMQLTSYPTTVVIDRYGTIGMIHKGMITETEMFTKIFKFFTSDDYKQTTIGSITDIE